MSHYLQYAKNRFSQNGEDGILDQLFKDLHIEAGIVVEFGAWDGVYLSNTYQLWRYEGFDAVLIESDLCKATELAAVTRAFDNVEAVYTAVSPVKDHKNSLDNILDRSAFDVTEDSLVLVSSDIDGSDYDIFKSMERHLPKVALIETCTHPNPVVNEEHPLALRAMTDLAEAKGYSLVCHTGNAVYVRNDLMHYLDHIDFVYEDMSCTIDDVTVLQNTGPEGESRTPTTYRPTRPTTATYKNIVAWELATCKALSESVTGG